MRPILFLVSASASYRLLKIVADTIRRDGRPVVFLYDRGKDDTFRQIEADAEALGCAAYAIEAETVTGITSGPVWRGHPRRGSGMAIAMRVALMKPGAMRSIAGVTMPSGFLRRMECDAPSGEITRLLALRDGLASQLAAARSFLARIKPAAMVACEDGISAPLAIHTAARGAGVPVIVIPYGYGVRRDLEIALDAKAAHGQLEMASGPWADIVRVHAPQWIKHGAHEGALMYPEAYILAAESLGITLRDAWIIHGGYADRLCVESEQMQRVYLDEGVPAAKLVPTGTPYCDVMVNALEKNPEARAAVRQPRRITPGITRVLVSWPPSYHADRAGFSEFGSYREMSVATLGWLQRQPGCEVAVSLHPATLAEDRAALVEAGVNLTDRYVIELIPQHDLFVTYFSSTIRWAIASGKPAINFDLYKLGLPVYEDAPGVTRVDTLADFQHLVTTLVRSDAAFAAAASRQIEVAPQWGVLDGENTARVVAAILAA